MRTATETKYPVAVNPDAVGKYPALTGSGGGYFYDDVLEYRVWVHPGYRSDRCYAFATYEDALAFSAEMGSRAEEPIALVRQREHINEPTPGQYVHLKDVRITEWAVELLDQKHKRTATSIADFLREHQRAAVQAVVQDTFKRNGGTKQ